MAVDIVGYINTAWTEVETPVKTAMLNDYCAGRGYNAESGLTKKQFMNKDVKSIIRDVVTGVRRDAAYALATWDDLEIASD